MRSTKFLILTAVVLCYAAEKPLPILDDPGWDLASYVSRPGLRAPMLNVTRHDPDAITPGYWFMAPYASLEQSDLSNEYVPYQAGPLIYDNEGELVWSGSHINRNRNTFDFRLSIFDNQPAFTFVLDSQPKALDHPDGAGLILDTSYQLLATVQIKKQGELLNFHEFNIIDGRSSLSAIERPMEIDISNIGIPPKTAHIANYGFREIDIDTGNITFEWYPAPDHVSITESMLMPPQDLGLTKRAWDCFHLNAVDKDLHGDYLISMRYTSTIYKISGRDGSILWRLGGKLTNFVQDFNFSSQHDAKFHSVNESVTVISFLDNASDERHRQPWTSSTSSVKLVALYTDTQPMTAKLLKSFYRPDGGLTMLRGQAQFLPNNGVFAGWAQQGYISEFAPDGKVLLEAKYTSQRFNSYRAYKYDFVGKPSEPPALVSHAYGEVGGMASVFYVSWNGATEVRSWGFYGRNNASEGANFTKLGVVEKAGFETTFFDTNFWAWAYVEAYGKEGRTLGKSEVVEILLPNVHGGNANIPGLLATQLTATLTRQAGGDGKKVTLQASKSTVIGAAVAVLVLTLTSVVSVSLLVWRRVRAFSNSSRSGVKYATLRDADLVTESEMTSFKIGDDDDDEHQPEYNESYKDKDEYKYGYKNKIGRESEDDEVGDMAPPPVSPRKYSRAGGHARTASTDGKVDANGQLPRLKTGHGRTTSADVDGGTGSEARRVVFSPHPASGS